MRQGGLRFMQKRNSDLEFEQCAIRIEMILAGEEISEGAISPLYQTDPFSADLTVPPVTPAPSALHVQGSPVKIDLFQRLSQNRIGRVMKVLWRGYY
jgi:hypothetical protein